MRLQVRLPPKIWEQLCVVAEAQHRPPKFQLELLLWGAIEQAMCDQQRQDDLQATEALGEPATPAQVA